MKRIHMKHYFAAILLLSIYCSAIVHFWYDVVPPFIDHSAHYLVLPVILPFMLYQETVYLTPGARDFPYLMAVYPIYFALLLSPLAFIAHRNQNRRAEQGVAPQSATRSEFDFPA